VRLSLQSWLIGSLSIVLLSTSALSATLDFTSLSAYNGVTANSSTINFNGILPSGTPFQGFNPLVVGGVSFSTPTAWALVNVTTRNFYSPNNYGSDIIVDSTSPSLNNVLAVAFSGTHALALDFGGLGFTGAGSALITLSNGHNFSVAGLPTVGNTEFVGFVSTDAITGLSLATTNDSWVVTDFTTSTTVPEPSSWILGLTALLAVRPFGRRSERR
jgi:hypothetical protein